MPVSERIGKHSGSMGRVLFVSKPLVPPWNDSSKNLARDVAAGLSRHTPVIFTDGSSDGAPSGAVVEPLYADRGGYQPRLGAQARVLSRLLTGPRADLWHFFFAPNPRSSWAGRLCSSLRRVPTIQTVCSRPRHLERARHLLFADVTVVLSRATLEGLRSVGVPSRRLVHIPPAVPSLDVPSASARREARSLLGLPLDAPIVLFPGDLELGDGAARMVDAFSHVRRDALLVMACRPKTEGVRAAEERLRARLAAQGSSERVRWIGETRHMHALLGAADVVALPSSDLYGKMDLPLVLLEAMWLARSVIVAADGPAAELAESGGAWAVGRDPEALGEQIDVLLEDGEALGAAARGAAEAHFHPSRMVAAYERLYDRVS